MKFLNLITACSILSTSLITAAPANANEWVHIGFDRAGHDRHARVLMKKGGIVGYQFAWKNTVKNGVILCEKNKS